MRGKDGGCEETGEGGRERGKERRVKGGRELGRRERVGKREKVNISGG